MSIQPDKAGGEGDVRDILIRRKDKSWEVGLSIKHNNFAVKHSRLAKTLDFGDKWFGIRCSDAYWEEVKPILIILMLNIERKLSGKTYQIKNSTSTFRC